MTKIKPFCSSGDSVKEEYGILGWDVGWFIEVLQLSEKHVCRHCQGRTQ